MYSDKITPRALELGEVGSFVNEKLLFKKEYADEEGGDDAAAWPYRWGKLVSPEVVDGMVTLAIDPEMDQKAIPLVEVRACVGGVRVDVMVTLAIDPEMDRGP